MSKITNDGLTGSGTECFIAVPIWQQRASKGQEAAILNFIHRKVAHTVYSKQYKKSKKKKTNSYIYLLSCYNIMAAVRLLRNRPKSKGDRRAAEGLCIVRWVSTFLGVCR